MADLVIKNIDTKLLRQQYFTLLLLAKLQPQQGTLAGDLNGLVELLEEIMVQNPEAFSMLDSKVVKIADYADRGYCAYRRVSHDLYRRLMNAKISGDGCIEPDRQGELWLEGPYAELCQIPIFDGRNETDPEEGEYDLLIKCC